MSLAPGPSAAAAALLALAVPLASAQDWFRAPVHVATTFQQGLAYNLGHQAGDVDGDGSVDLVFTRGASLVAVLNDGAGALTDERVTLLAGAATNFDNRGVLADVDGDGDRDFVCRAIGGGTALFLWDTGAGSFGAPLLQPTAAGPVPLLFRAVDVDGDNDDELAVLSYGGTLPSQVAFWDWDGSQLVAGAPGSFSYQWNAWGNALVATDLTGDGVPDIGVVVGSSSGQKSLKIFPTVGGAPGAASDIALDTLAKVLIYTGEREGDGDLDLLVVSESTTTVDTRLQWLENIGGGQYVAGPFEAYGPLAGLECAVGDWDGDGDSDVVSGPLLIRNLGDGDLSGPSATTLDGEPLAIVDATGDGRADVLTTRVLFGGDGGTQFGSDATLHGQLHAAGDIDGDGDLDLRSRFPAGPSAIDLRNDATATFVDGVGQYPALPEIQYYSGIAPPADFDGDGRLDLVREVWEQDHPFLPATHVRTVLLSGGPDGDWVEQPASATTVPLAASSLFVPWPIDVDVDGDLDLVTFDGFLPSTQALNWRENDGAGHFSAPVALGTDAIRDHGDVDGDGDTDLVVGPTAAQPTQTDLLRNQGGGSFTSEPFLPAWSTSLVDFDGDGDLDAVGLSIASTPAAVVARENVGGVFGPDYVAGVLAGPCWPDVFVAGDVSGDGVVDLVGTTIDPNDVNVPILRGLAGTSPPTFAPARCFLTSFVAAIADLDSDGDLDLAGAELFLGRAVHGPDAPLVRQYGVGAAGAGGWRPLLGSSGVPRVGETVETRLLNGPGGALSFYFYGTLEAYLPNFPAPGLDVLIGGWFPAITFVLDGAPGDAGAGGFAFPYPVLSGFVGLDLYKQALVVDVAGPVGLTLSNAVHVRYGS